MNRLLFGDNLTWLRDQTAFPDESVDLIYLDPPFNSNADYNVLFKEASGEESRAQFHAFTDTWHWADAESTYRDFLKTCPIATAISIIEGFHDNFLGTSPMMAYLAMMAPRLVEMHRILKATGSIYLHCDPTASHYIKLVLDAIFGPQQFDSEIIWRRYGAHNDSKSYGAVHDVILFYNKSQEKRFNKQYQPYDQEYLAERFRFRDPDGRRWAEQNLSSPHPRPNLTYSFKAKNSIVYRPPANGWKCDQKRMQQLDDEDRLHYPEKEGGRLRLKSYLDELPGVAIQDVWTDIVTIGGTSQERLGYQTQKPVALLERIIKASSNEGDVVLDPFCGCGTTVAAAQKLNRQWTGIDITYLAINLIKRRLGSAFGPTAKYEEEGQPVDLAGAQALAKLDRFQFQQWALDLVEALPVKAGSGKGKDYGVDGLLFFYESKDVRRKILVQVKSGHVAPSDIAALIGDVDNQKAAGGIFITLEPPTEDMRKKAVEAGRYTSALWVKTDYPKIQILTVQHLLDGTEPDTPPLQDPFTKAPPVEVADQLELPK